MFFDTLSVHAGEAHDKSSGSLTDPVYQTATFTFPSTEAVQETVAKTVQRFEYGRYGNPSEQVVERKLAALEGAERSLLFASGMSALSALLLAKLRSGDEIVIFDECYYQSRKFCSEHLARFGIRTTEVRMGNYEALEWAITPRTKLLVSESPTNPQLTVLDLQAFIAIGRAHGVATLVDATLSTPYNLRPLAAGATYVLHSATKYFGGHNDLLAGVLLGSTEALEDVRVFREVTGAICAPQNCFLLQRGLKTFALRMERHNANGLAVARFLEGHPCVARVLYPGLDSHPTYRLAHASMKGFGGMVTFFVKDADRTMTSAVVDAVQIPRISPSLGGVESLIQQPNVMSAARVSEDECRRYGIEDNMIRLSCGIEDPRDLIADLDQALRSACGQQSTPSLRRS